MVNERVHPEDPIHQGYIFISVPRHDISLTNLVIVSSDDQAEQVTWRELIDHGNTDAVT
jgi:hypothetical protein